MQQFPTRLGLKKNIFMDIKNEALSVNMGRDSSVSIVTVCGLDGLGIESRWESRFSAPVQTGRGAHAASCTTGTRSFRGVKSGRGVTLTPQPLLVPWSWKGRAQLPLPPLFPLEAVRPVQSLSACTTVHFTLPQCLYKCALYLFIFNLRNEVTMNTMR